MTTTNRKLFEVGEIVILKRTGRAMTVSAIHPGGVLVCLWFVGSSVHEGTFHHSELRTAK
jgi:uncharacterized protein YodC (DUF2158 family)